MKNTSNTSELSSHIRNMLAHRPIEAQKAIENKSRKNTQEAFGHLDIERLVSERNIVTAQTERLIEKMKKTETEHGEQLKKRNAQLKRWDKFIIELDSLLETHKIDIPNFNIHHANMVGLSMIKKLKSLNPTSSVLIEGSHINQMPDTSKIIDLKELLFEENIKMELINKMIKTKTNIYRELLSADKE